MNCRDCQIIEIAMLTVENNEITDVYNEFINIDHPLPLKITEITSITDDMLKTYGIDERKVAEYIANNLTPDTVMIAHNCQFDLSFVYTLLKRHFPHDADEIVSNVGWLDTLTVLKDRKKYPHKLIDAVNYYNIGEVNFHRAIDDTKVLLDVTIALKNERDDLLQYINVFGYNPKYGVSGLVFPFITYKKQNFNNFMVSSDNILPNK